MSPRSRGGVVPRVDLGQWGEVGTLVLLIAITVCVMDILSAKIRERIV